MNKEKHWSRKIFEVPNLFTLFRLLATPVLWYLAIKGYWTAVGILYLLASSTDSLDGYFARRLGLESGFGSQLDSIADHLLGPSAVIWLVMMSPSIFTDNWIIFSIGILAYLARLGFGLLKFKRFANMHLYSSKIFSGLFFGFLVVSFLMGRYWPPFFYFLISFFIVSALENIVIMAMHKEVDEHMRSIVHVFLKRRDHPVSS